MQYSRHNYGALLQAAALEHVVRMLVPEAEVEHIDARPAWLMNAKPKSLRQWCSFLKRSIRALVTGWPGVPTRGNFNVFSSFRDDHLQLTKKHYVEDADFECENWDYDIVVVGSDQVFRVKFVKKRADVFFLKFLPESCKRIAYAASFGVDYWEGEGDAKFTDAVRRDLVKFDAISVRESSGVDICRNTFGLDAQHVLDPTLLIGREYFDRIIEDAALTVTASDWSLHSISEDAPFIEQVPGLSQKHDKSLKDIYYSREERWPLAPRAHFSAVPEWLEQIRSTEKLVFTDSFHCVCFCILFEKDFLVFISKAKGPGRMLSLLGMLGLEDRICSDQETLTSAVEGRSAIDYQAVSVRLSEERKRSRLFLEDALQASV